MLHALDSNAFSMCGMYVVWGAHMSCVCVVCVNCICVVLVWCVCVLHVVFVWVICVVCV